MNPLTEHTRPATQADAGQIASLLGQLGYPASSESVSAKLHLLAGNPHDAVFVAEIAGRLAGVVSLHVLELFHAEGRLGRITSLVVDSAHRGKGTGRRLLQAADEYLSRVAASGAKSRAVNIALPPMCSIKLTAIGSTSAAS